MSVKITTEDGSVSISVDGGSTVKGLRINGKEYSVEKGVVTVDNYPIVKRLPSRKKDFFIPAMLLAMVVVVGLWIQWYMYNHP